MPWTERRLNNAGIETIDGAAFNDDVLENLVHRVANVDVAIGVGWAIVQHKRRATF